MLDAMPTATEVQQRDRALVALPHTTRAAITGLRNRGYSVIRERIEDGGSAYRISDAPSGGSDALVSSPETALARRRGGAKAKQAA